MKKKIVLLTAFALVAILVAGGTMAWFTSNPEAVTNTFKAGTVKIKVNEHGFKDKTNVNPGDCYDKVVTVKSHGSKATYVRVQLTPEWKDKNEEPMTDTDGVVAYGIKDQVLQVFSVGEHEINSDDSVSPMFIGYYCFKCKDWHWVWEKCPKSDPEDPKDPEDPIPVDDKWVYHDGWFYYKEILNKGHETEALIEQVCFDGPSMNDNFQAATFTLEVKAEAVQASHGAYMDVWELDELPNGVETWTE